jgi:DNA polymerase-3 subunit delta'
VTFRDVVGHDEQLAQLRSAVATRPAAAWLLVGPAGVGKRRIANALASRLLCEAVRDDDACGVCRHCLRVAAGSHPDLLVVVRDDDRRDIRVDQIRELIQWFALRPMMAARKVAIVDGAHQVNEAGQNALLKTLEEPPGDAAIILVSETLSRLLPTVRSRCRRLRLDRLPPAAVATVLESHGLDPETARRLAALSRGSVQQALALADAGREELRGRTLAVLAELSGAAAVDLSAFAAALGREDAGAGLDVAVSWYRDLLRLTIAGPDTEIANVEARPALVAAAAATAPETALRLLEVVCDTVDAVGRNANKTLVLETMLLELRRLVRRTEQAPWTTTAS